MKLEDVHCLPKQQHPTTGVVKHKPLAGAGKPVRDHQ
jgi:hypothetical protein